MSVYVYSETKRAAFQATTEYHNQFIGMRLANTKGVYTNKTWSEHEAVHSKLLQRLNEHPRAKNSMFQLMPTKHRHLSKRRFSATRSKVSVLSECSDSRIAHTQTLVFKQASNRRGGGREGGGEGGC